MPYPGLLHPESLPLQQSMLICTSLGDTQTQFYLSLCGVSGSWHIQGLFEPSEPLWWVWGLILNAFSPLLSSCWSFSFALGPGVSPQSHSSTVQPPLQHHIATTQALCSRSSSNYHTIALISHASKVMFKILQARLQQYVN